MNKWITLSIITVLLIGVIITGILYAQENSRLKEARVDIVGLQGDVSGLEGDLAATETDLAATETDLAATETDLAATETDLAASEAEVSALETDLAEAEDLVSNLEAELDQANSAIQTQQNLNLTLSEGLAKVQDPRHFESLEELEAWLAQDDTDTRIRWASLPPEQKAFILQVRALRDGFLLPAWFEDFNLGITGSHLDEDHLDGIIDFVGNLAYIGDEIYYVWAANDTVSPFAVMVFPIPSHPLPLD